MLLPFMADGIVMYRLECKADVIAFVVDGITTGSYLSLSSMLFIRTSSHTCGRWYLPMFLFRDGLLTLMNIDSFIRFFYKNLIPYMWQMVKESMYIRVNNPSLNKNIGKYHLPHVWDEVLIKESDKRINVH